MDWTSIEDPISEPKASLPKFWPLTLSIVFILYVICLYGELFNHDHIYIPEPSYGEVSSEMLSQLYLSTKISMEYFVNFVSNNSQYSMINPEYFNSPMKYLFHTFSTEKDIQILYSYDENPFNENSYNFGHFYVACFNIKTGLISIYDSCVHSYTNINKFFITLKEGKKFKKLWPSYTKIQWEMPKTLQEDCFSCGVFAIAYATLLILGYDPKCYDLALINWSYNQTYPLREHILHMFQEQKLLPFPHK